MKMESFEDFLSEKQKLEDFLQKLEYEINSCLDDFERVSIDKLNQLNEMIIDNENLAKIIGKKFLEDFLKLKSNFNFFISTFEEVKRFKLETTLEDFLITIQLLKKDLFDLS